ncbi:hypothetical protein GCM10025857_31440 [Alicyclobacillus contaminans]|uniref:peptidoglycan-binding protein n=1 Tax=Alicyclobacillus contaminans TaxID=392016 RepID=UPI00042074E1|nr:peptidoglycan-binding protein [Alicyclobacillus contaminans]GMA51787.1 hypothetical protein GCM10025857_31440 [Alicyclobacillus contaminans]
MRYTLPACIVAGTAMLIAILPPSVATAGAVTFTMRHTRIELNASVLSAPSAFTYAGTTYMPLYYVEQLLNKLNVKNQWTGSVWKLTTSFDSQPTFVLQTRTGAMAITINGKTFAAHVDKQVARDPASNSNTTFVPIWYIQQTLQSMGLQNTWDGTTWNVKANYEDVTKTGTTLGWFTQLSDAEQALLEYPGGMVKDLKGQTVFTEESFTNVDLRYPAPSNINATSLNAYLTQHNSIMAGLGQTFMDAQARYGVNANYLVSHALEETGSDGNVSDIALNKNNLYGYGAYDSNAYQYAGTFPSQAYAILFQAWEVRSNYLNPGSSHYVSPTLSGMAKNYASDSGWAAKVNDLMDQLAIDVHDNVTSYTQYSPSNQPTVPAGSETEPVYYMNSATATVKADPYYGTSVPVYADSGTGYQHMFARELQSGAQGDDVKTLQQALNAAESVNLQVDGIFGSQTESALKAYQTSHGLAATGVCDFQLWNNLLGLSDNTGTVSAGQTVNVDQVVQGMAGDVVVEWYHIPNVGWINAGDVTWNNVYRLTVSNPKSAADVSVPVYNEAGQTVATLHAGDEVVADSGSAVGGQIAIRFANQDTGAAMSGYIRTSQATLTQVTH